MKKLEETNEKVVVEFTREEYRQFARMTIDVHEEYEVLDPVLLDMTEDEVRTFVQSVYRMDGFEI
jgi:hypothetical protein